jgi:hypothetical protein
MIATTRSPIRPSEFNPPQHDQRVNTYGSAKQHHMPQSIAVYDLLGRALLQFHQLGSNPVLNKKANQANGIIATTTTTRAAIRTSLDSTRLNMISVNTPNARPNSTTRTSSRIVCLSAAS